MTIDLSELKKLVEAAKSPVGYAEVGHWGSIDPSTCTTFYRDQDQKPLYTLDPDTVLPLIEEVEKLQALLTQAAETFDRNINRVLDERAELIERLEAAERDAARYRKAYYELPERIAKFCFGAKDQPGNCSMSAAYLSVAHCLSAKDGLDAAMASEKEKK